MKIGNNVGAGSSYFKPKDHLNDLALLFEVKDFQENVPNNFQGTNNVAVADITVFTTEADFNGQPKVLKNCKIDKTYISNELRNSVGQAEIGVVAQQPSKTKGFGPAWVLKRVPDDIRQAVVDYVERTEAALEATLASDDVPAFLR